MARTSKDEFSAKVKRQAYDRCDGVCDECGLRIKPKKPQYDHIKRVADGGDNSLDNCAVLCVPCHSAKTANEATETARAIRVKNRDVGAKVAKVKIKSRGFQKAEKSEYPPPTATRLMSEIYRRYSLDSN